jgi:hypothetical protein
MTTIKKAFCVLLLLTSLLGCTEQQPTPELSPRLLPSLTGSTLFRDDQLHVDVRPQAKWGPTEDMRDRYYLPTIEAVTFVIDGADVDLPVEIGEFWGKGGWHSTAHFTVPEDAQEIETRLRVLYKGRPFEMTTIFKRRINPTINPDDKWHATHGDTVPLEE